ncbi:MAG: hypothetical protein RKU31_20255 [Deltaproteobacteria bacterium]|jgi:uncharacterized integral membrane protein
MRLGKHPVDRPARLVIIWSMVVGLVISGLAFAYKVAEFMFTMSNPEFAGSFDVPIIVYFAIAAGWLSLLVWCFMTGKFKDMERAKYEMLAREEQYERLGI